MIVVGELHIHSPQCTRQHSVAVLCRLSDTALKSCSNERQPLLSSVTWQPPTRYLDLPIHCAYEHTDNRVLSVWCEGSIEEGCHTGTQATTLQLRPQPRRNATSAEGGRLHVLHPWKACHAEGCNSHKLLSVDLGVRKRGVQKQQQHVKGQQH